MKKNLLIALWFTLVTTAMFGVLYPLAITGLAQVFFLIAPTDSSSTRTERSGSKLSDNPSPGRAISIRGRLLLEPDTTQPLAGVEPGSDEQSLAERVQSDVQKLKAENPGVAIPIDLVTTSGSGLDPEISPAAAQFQLQRVARERGVKEQDLRTLVQKHTKRRELGILGEPRVNVLELNLELDSVHPLR